jgi:hypothetical protein
MMNNAVFLPLLLVLVTVTVRAQLSVSNLLEYQLGNLPETDPSDRTGLYDQLNLSYRYDRISLETRVESFQTQDRSANYARFTQKSITFEDGDIGVTVGNYYHIMGRGLLLRSYEIPGTVIEDLSFRSRYGFYRDIEGIAARYRGDLFELYLIHGRPLNNTLPPTQSGTAQWRPHLLQGAEGRVYLGDWQIGAAYLRDETGDRRDEFGSLSAGVALPLDMQIYGEYARKSGGGQEWLDLSDQSGHALYASWNGLFGALGASFEYKDYNDFQLGYNDPPPLVKEHQYLLLNRNTHNAAAINETGWQSEFYYIFEGGHLINVNFSEAVNELFGNRFLFQEQFAEFSYKTGHLSSIKVFFDRNMEGLMSVEDRYTTGLYFDSEIFDQWGAIIDLQYQTYRYTVGETGPNRNLALILSASYAPDLAFGVVTEYSDDPNYIPEGKTGSYWVGMNISYQYSQVHLITFFYGSRRGGNACTSGICYEILPFEGAEVRLNSTF